MNYKNNQNKHLNNLHYVTNYKKQESSIDLKNYNGVLIGHPKPNPMNFPLNKLIL